MLLEVGDTTDAWAHWEVVYAQYLTSLAEKLAAAKTNTWNTVIAEFLATSEPTTANPKSFLQNYNEETLKSSITSKIHIVCAAYLERENLTETGEASEIQLF